MGGSLAVSSYRHDDCTAVAAAIVEAVARLGGRATLGGEWPTVAVQAPDNGWTSVIWDPLDPFLRLGVETARTLGTAGMVTDIYDGDFWRFVVADGDGIHTRFHSDPEYFEGVGQEWRSPDPIVAGRVLGVDPWSIAPYLAAGGEAGGYAHDGDRCELDDPWVFVDLWHRIGATYPDGSAAPAAVVTLDDVEPITTTGEP